MSEEEKKRKKKKKDEAAKGQVSFNTGESEDVESYPSAKSFDDDSDGADSGEEAAPTTYMYEELTDVKEGICALIYRKSPLQFLIVQNERTGAWSLVSGGKLKDETHEDALKRELFTSIGVSRYEHRDTNLTFEFTYEDSGLQGRQRIYLVELDQNTNVYPGPGLMEVKWVARESMYQYISYAELRRVLENLGLSF